MTATTSPPNILLVMVDELAPQATPIHGHPIVQAPHLARLATQSVVFDNAYTNSPLCAPARAVMLTGQLAPSIGAWDNASELPASIPTLAHYLRHLGYETSLCGKMHFIGPDQLHGYEERLTTDIYPANFAWTANWSLPADAPNPAGISMRPVVEAGPCVRNMQIDYDDEVEYEAARKLYDLARRGEGARPFFLTVSFTQPHPPFVTDQRNWDRYANEEIDLPRVPPIPLAELDVASRSLYYNHRRDRYTITDDHVRNARRAYYGMISCVDEKLGHLLAVLEETGQADNTVVVFTSDHGEMLGERGMWLKMTMFEYAVRIPLVIRYPGRMAARRVARNVSLVDLLPTLLDIASDGHPPQLADRCDGRSMRRLLLTGADAGWPDTVISDFSAGGVPGPIRMVKRGAHKYIHLAGRDSLLFDLDSDPDELTNLAGTAAAGQLEAELSAIAFAGYDPIDVERQVRASQRRRLFIKGVDEQSAMAGNWSFVARPGDDARFVRGSGLAGGEHATKARARYPYVEPARETPPPGKA
ncbi:MAG: choline-sulfatase [Burkholderiaceae bacterium]